jgi:TatD DNase family protein
MDLGVDGTYEYFDTHTHFLDADSAETDQVVQRAIAAGVSCMLVPAVDLANSETVVTLASAYPQVFAAVGIHPNDAAAGDDFTALARLAGQPRVRAIGETGLDYYREHTSPSLQKMHLESHMRLAADLQLPIILHNRKADEDIYAIASHFAPSVVGVLHCFSGPLEFARRFLDLGYYISFAGNLTYPSAGNLREAAAQIPVERLLVETDSPYLSPVPFRGKRNQPANVVHTAQALAQVRGMSIAELAPVLVANARRLFGLK